MQGLLPAAMEVEEKRAVLPGLRHRERDCGRTHRSVCYGLSSGLLRNLVPRPACSAIIFTIFSLCVRSCIISRCVEGMPCRLAVLYARARARRQSMTPCACDGSALAHLYVSGMIDGNVYNPCDSK